MINEFISQVKSKGLARSNRFAVRIPLPFADNEQSNIIRLFCDTVQLPGINIESTPQRFWGEVRQLPFDRSFGEINLTFYMDTNMTPKKLFDDWISLIQNPDTRALNYYNSYVQDVTIEVLELGSDNVVYEVELREAYPKSISQIQLDSSSKEVMKLNVSLAYKYYITKNAPLDPNPFPNENNQDPTSTFRGEGYSTAVDPIPQSSFPQSPIEVANTPKIAATPPITGQGTIGRLIGAGR